MCYNVIVAHRGYKMERQQVNIRLPKIITKCVENEAKMIDVSRNTYYTMVLYEYLRSKGILDAQRKN